MTAHDRSLPVYAFRPGMRRRELRELWRSRELLYFFVWKEFSVRYKQTFIGVVWVVLQPLAFALMFSAVILSKSSVTFQMDKGSDFLPLYVGMCFWLMVSSAVMNGSTALLNSYSLLSKVYVNRHIPLLATTVLAVVDFLFAISLVPFFALLTGTPLNPTGFLLSVLIVVPLAVVTHGIVMLLAAAVLRFRDLRIVVPYGVNLLFFFSSALFPLALYSSGWRNLVLSNPIAVAIDLARHYCFAIPSELTRATNTDAATVCVLLALLGIISFARTRRRLVEQL